MSPAGSRGRWLTRPRTWHWVQAPSLGEQSGACCGQPPGHGPESDHTKGMVGGEHDQCHPVPPEFAGAAQGKEEQENPQDRAEERGHDEGQGTRQLARRVQVADACAVVSSWPALRWNRSTITLPASDANPRKARKAPVCASFTARSRVRRRRRTMPGSTNSAAQCSSTALSWVCVCLSVKTRASSAVVFSLPTSGVVASAATIRTAAVIRDQRALRSLAISTTWWRTRLHRHPPDPRSASPIGAR